MFHTAFKQSKTGGWNSLETRLGQHTIKLLVHAHQLESHVHHMLPSHLHGELKVSPNSMCVRGNPVSRPLITISTASTGRWVFTCSASCREEQGAIINPQHQLPGAPEETEHSNCVEYIHYQIIYGKKSMCKWLTLEFDTICFACGNETRRSMRTWESDLMTGIDLR